LLASKIAAKGIVKETSFQAKSITTQMIAPYEFEKPENELTAKQAEEANIQLG
jgi:hypothetical protein